MSSLKQWPMRRRSTYDDQQVESQSAREWTHPFQNPKRNPDIVPSEDQPTNGGKDTRIIENHRMIYAHGERSHSSATGPSHTKIFPARTTDAIPRAPRSSEAATYIIFWIGVILSHRSRAVRYNDSAWLIIRSRNETASPIVEWRRDRLGEWLHGGRRPENRGDCCSSGSETGSDNARAVDW